jgi:hypothetical protein
MAAPVPQQTSYPRWDQVFPQPGGNSQIYPNGNESAPRSAPKFEPTITLLSVSLHWENLLSQEKHRANSLQWVVDALQEKIQGLETTLLRNEAELAGVKQENIRLSREVVEALEERLSRMEDVSVADHE